nr:hypothetical protein Iba_chr01bCG4230 [Ipomoea batatas]GME05465.1 hypothetical protein Iba_scaffold3007CG0010 [Ipomoea batatas]
MKSGKRFKAAEDRPIAAVAGQGERQRFKAKWRGRRRQKFLGYMALFLVAGDDDGWSVVGDAIVRSWWSVMDFGLRSSVTVIFFRLYGRLGRGGGATVAVLRRQRRGCVAASEALLQQAGDGEDKATSGSVAVALRLDGWRWRWLCNSVASVVRKTKKQARKTKTIAEV